MIFSHNFLESYELPSTTTDQGRIYSSPIGPLRSVTTILGESQDKTYLDAWRKAVGEEEAERQSSMATRHGSIIHDLAEKHLRNESWQKGIMPNNKFIMKQLAPLLDSHISEVYGIEYPLWSRYLKTAGRADLICDWDGFVAVADFKTSKETLTLQGVIERGYFLQTTAYSIMLEERRKIRATKLVIINIPEFEPPTFFVQYRDSYLKECIKIFTGRFL